MAATPQTSKLGLKTYTGAWNNIVTKHLLNRTMYGAKIADINYFTQLGLEASVDQLLTISKQVNSFPLNDYNSSTLIDPKVAAGETWINDITTDGTINSARRATYKKWLISVIANQQMNIQEKMTTFWSNHFGTEADTIVYGSMIYNHHRK